MSSIQAAADNLALRAGNFCGKTLRAEVGPGSLSLRDTRDGACHAQFHLGGSVVPCVRETYGRLSHTGLSYGEILKLLLDSRG
jgi:hypothetical protein